MKSYLIRPSIRKILYVLILSLGTFFLGRKFDDMIYQVVGAFAQFAALYVILQRLYPRHLRLSETQLIVPRFLPGQNLTLNLSDIKGYTVQKTKNRWTMSMKMKSGKMHSLDVDDVEKWEEFHQLFAQKVPTLSYETMPLEARKRLGILGILVGVVLFVAAKQGFLDERAALYSGIAIAGLIGLSFFIKQPK